MSKRVSCYLCSMDKGATKPLKEKNKKGRNHNDPKVSFNGNFEQLINIVAPPIKRDKKKE